jgi:hypothetical protein
LRSLDCLAFARAEYERERKEKRAGWTTSPSPLPQALVVYRP